MPPILITAAASKGWLTAWATDSAVGGGSIPDAPQPDRHKAASAAAIQVLFIPIALLPVFWNSVCRLPPDYAKSRKT